MMLGCKVATVVEQLEHIIYSASLMAIHHSLLWIPAVLCIQVECKKINFLASQYLVENLYIVRRRPCFDFIKLTSKGVVSSLKDLLYNSAVNMPVL